jgi:hypothetical protein
MYVGFIRKVGEIGELLLNLTAKIAKEDIKTPSSLIKNLASCFSTWHLGG